jgi:hypothetical protein
MVRRADEAVAFHPLDPLRGGVVADPHLALEPRARGLLVLEHDLARLAVLALLGVVARGELVVEPEHVVLGLLGHRIDVSGRALAAPVGGDALDLLVADERAVDALERAAARLV